MDQNEVQAHLAAEIRKRAERKGLPLAQLADLSGYSRSYLWMVLRGKHSPTLAWISAVADALDCRARDLLP